MYFLRLKLVCASFDFTIRRHCFSIMLTSTYLEFQVWKVNFGIKCLIQKYCSMIRAGLELVAIDYYVLAARLPSPSRSTSRSTIGSHIYFVINRIPQEQEFS